jgi:ATP adenylyltransferase
MDRLWTPWRYRYIAKASPASGCIFCAKAGEADDDDGNLIVHRANRNFVLLNLFPYSCGHLMIAPYEHVDTLAGAASETAAEMMELARHSERVLRQVYRCPGINLGMNLGECAGAGVAGHIHLHVVPRWPGDANFMTTTAETRVLPEDLPVTLARLRAGWDA